MSDDRRVADRRALGRAEVEDDYLVRPSGRGGGCAVPLRFGLRARGRRCAIRATAQRAFGLDLVGIERGEAEFTARPDGSGYNVDQLGARRTGVCTLLDSVLGCAVHTTLSAGMGYTSIDIKVNYLRPVRAGAGVLRARGRVTKAGCKIAFAEGTVRDSADATAASASGSGLILSA